MLKITGKDYFAKNNIEIVVNGLSDITIQNEGNLSSIYVGKKGYHFLYGTIKMKDVVKVKETKWREVPFNVMLKCHGEVKCGHRLLDNSIRDYGKDLREPMLFNKLLELIGVYFSNINCKILFEEAKWYVIDDGVQPDYYLSR